MLTNAKLTEEYNADELPVGVELLRGQYQIEKYLVRGGFGITYLARDSLGRRAVIKECFPDSICCRVNGGVQARGADQTGQYASILRHFLKEARRLARLEHPNIVGIHQVFEENNTAYIAMDYVDGVDLLTILDEEPERLTTPVLHKALLDALDAISYTHKHEILHRDISPDNFLMDADNNLILIDFGASREHCNKGNKAWSALLAVKDGYSPHEFYLTDSTQSPCSDLYSLGATFYHLITGEAPPNSQERLAALAAGNDDPYRRLAVSAAADDYNFKASIDRALSVLQNDRIQLAEEWILILNAEQADPEIFAPVEWDSGLLRAISRLVEDTNTDVEPGSLKTEITAVNRGKKSESEGADLESPAPLVDIFGNPIQDVKVWLREQDRMSKKLRKAQAADTGAIKQSEQENTRAQSKIRRFLSGCLPSRRVSVSPELPN